MTFRHLLAKSSVDPLNPKPWETLIGHTEQTIESANVLLETIGSEAFESILETDFNIFRKGLLASAWLHDLGKANDHFQKAVRGKREKQGIRHETLGLVLSFDIFNDWLAGFWRQFPDWVKPAVLLSLCGHHLKFPDTKTRPGTKVQFLGGHKDFREFIKRGVELLGLPESPTFSDKTYSLPTTDSDGIDKKLFRIRRDEIFDRDWDFSQKRFVAVLKSMLMCADLAGSAFPKKTGGIQEWLKTRCKNVLHQSEIREVVEKKINGRPLRYFQQQIQAVSTPTVLLEAACGAGKTVAAYLWAEKFAVERRLFFCYPTTATASEGFSGYLQEPAFEAILKHSRVDVDYRLLENMPERSLSSQRLHAQQLEAIDTWPVPVVVCTAHAVLGILQNYRTGIYSFPSMVRSAFVFDEIHSFSSKLFQHLLRFLEIFSKVPVLLMTATLPPGRKNELLKLAEKRGGIEILEGAKEREESKRYVLHQSTFERIWERVKESILEGGKVLWVCNTIPRAISVVKQALEDGFPVIPFHSRFKYRDRLQRQRGVIDGFLQGKPPMLAVTTQVAEMSLDISADVLISEYAPIPAMIQRLGRLNRFEDIPEVCKNAYFYKPENLFPYASQKEEAEELSNGIGNWLDKVANQSPQSQRDLFSAFLQIQEKCGESTEGIVCEWFDDPWLSRENQRSIMEAGYTIDLILQEDLESKNLQEVVIPMPFPKRADSQNWSWKGRYLIAPTGTVKYDEFTGGEYADRQNDPWII